jgi:hypothetical protein
LRWAISAPNIVAVAATNIRVAVKIVIVIDIYIVVAPAASPTPTAAPKCPHHHTNTKGNSQPGGVVPCRGIVNRRVGIEGRTPDHHGIIRRHIDDLRIRLFDHDHTLVLDDLDFHLLLVGWFQIAVVLGFFSHSLHGIHDITLLGEERIAQVSGPLNIVRQALHNIRECG